MAPNDDDENQALQQAIKESLAARNTTTSTQFGDSGAPALSAQDEAQNPTRRANIEDRIKEMSLQPALELPFVREPAGDTWIYIDPPPKQPEQDQLDYSRYIRRYESPMLVKRATLLKHCTPDSTVEFSFETLFGPSAQFRTVRRRNLTNKLRASPNVKYVIDLTPPTEGDDAVYLTTELCCSEGVRLWYQASNIWSVSKILVGGKEEYTSGGRSASASSQKAIVEEYNGISIATDGTSLSPQSTGTLMPLEYSPLRHRSAIERVIAALVGLDPKLDSAPKVWTTFAVAKFLGLKHSPVTDYIVRWLRAYPNSFFLEVCPEVSLRIADGLEIHDLARDAFAILVGEEALDSLVRARLPHGNHQRSVYGRKKEDLPEKIYSRIEYASKRFLERINNDFQDFAGEEMQWVDQLPEIQKLTSNAQPELQDTIKALKVLLKKYVRGTIYKLLCVNYDYVPPPDLHRLGGDELIQRWSRSKVWTDLSVSERILSRTFWHTLLSFGMFEGPSNLDIQKGWNKNWNSVRLSSEEKRQLDLGTYCQVQNADLSRLIRRGNLMILLAKEKHQQSVTLPDRTRSQARTVGVDHFIPSTEPWQPDNNLNWVHTAPPEALVKDSVSALQPSEPIDVHQASSGFAPQNFQFEFDPNPTPDSRSVSQADDPNWPFGPPRNCDAAHASRNEERHVTFVENNLVTFNDSLETPVHAPKTGKCWGQWPAQPGLKSWSTWELGDSLANSRGVEQDVLSQQLNPNGRSTLPGSTHPQENGERWIDPKKQKTGSEPAITELFDLHEFFLQAKASIEATARRKLQYADCLMREEPHEIGITNTLVCLQDSEWKYLPLWAGGYDDGTGGVFNDQLPAAALGFSAPGPDVHTGITPANSIRTPSEFSMVDSDYSADTVNTVNTSMANNRSFSGALHRKRVYAAETMDSTSSDDFDIVTAEGNSEEEEEARRQTEAQERVEAAEDEAACEAQRIEKGTAKFVDENYADLFNDDEGDETDRADDGDSMMNESDEDDDTVNV